MLTHSLLDFFFNDKKVSVNDKQCYNISITDTVWKKLSLKTRSNLSNFENPSLLLKYIIYLLYRKTSFHRTSLLPKLELNFIKFTKQKSRKLNLVMVQTFKRYWNGKQQFLIDGTLRTTNFKAILDATSQNPLSGFISLALAQEILFYLTNVCTFNWSVPYSVLFSFKIWNKK